jgi:Carboxypeptidase regulatory-like domain
MPNRLASIVGLAVALAIVPRAPLLAQQVRGVVSDSVAGAPLPGAVVSLLDSAGATSGRTITDAMGRFAFQASARPARLRVIRIGYQPRDVALGRTQETSIRIALAHLPTTLAAMLVNGRELCPGSEDRGSAFQLWEQARAGLMATVVARESNPAQTVVLTFKRQSEPTNPMIRHLETRIANGASTRPFVASASAAEFARSGYMTEDSTGRTYFAPDADVLLDESFASTHCFHLAADNSVHPGQIGLAFTPAPGRGRDTLVEVTGVIWIDRSTPAVRTLDFLYTALERPATQFGAGGHIEFVTVPNGISFVERWVLHLVNMEVLHLRAPVSEQLAFKPRRRRDRTDLRATNIDETGGQVLAADWPDGTRWRAPETGVTGHVVQTDAGVPVAHALVSVTGSADTVETDAQGAFSFRRMVPGRYELVAADTTISAHVPARRVLQVVDVPRDRVVEVRLKVPPLTDLLADLCENQRRPRNSTAILGHVIPDGRALPKGATIFAKWQAFENSGVGRIPTGVTTTQQTVEIDDSGRFIVCGVAVDRPVQLRLNVGDVRMADTTFYSTGGTFSTIAWRVPR